MVTSWMRLPFRWTQLLWKNRACLNLNKIVQAALFFSNLRKKDIMPTRQSQRTAQVSPKTKKTTIQKKLAQIGKKIPKRAAVASKTLSNGNKPTPIPQIRSVPFTNLGQWIVQAVHAVFEEDKPLVAQLVDSMRKHIDVHRREHNEFRKALAQKVEFKQILPQHLFALIDRLDQLFQYRSAVYERGTQNLCTYLSLMMERARSVSDELVAQESKMDEILNGWTETLEQDRDTLVNRIRQSAQSTFQRAPENMFGAAVDHTPEQLDMLLEQGNQLFDKIAQLRQHRVDAILSGNTPLQREIEKHLRDALSKAHAITGARQYFYTSQGEPTLVRFTKNTNRLKQDLNKLLTLPKLYHNDYELAARQFQSTIDENVGGMRLFAILRMRQEFYRAAQELREEMCRQVKILFDGVRQELKLLDDEIEVLNSEFLAEFARARLDETLRDRVAVYIKALYVASDMQMAQLDRPFLSMISSPLRDSQKRRKQRRRRQQIPQSNPTSPESESEVPGDEETDPRTAPLEESDDTAEIDAQDLDSESE